MPTDKDLKSLVDMILDPGQDQKILAEKLGQLGDHFNTMLANYQLPTGDEQNEEKGLTLHHDEQNEEKGLTLLHFAVAEDKSEVTHHLIKVCSKLIYKPRTDADYLGQTPFHIAIAMGKADLVKKMLSIPKMKSKKLLRAKASGDIFNATVMMGELPLSVAALQAASSGSGEPNFGVLDILLKRKADLAAVDSKGNTVFHNLVKYAFYYREKSGHIIKVLEHILEGVFGERGSFNQRKNDKIRDILFMENANGLTALRIAAKHGLKDIFYFLFDRKGMYKLLNNNDGVFEICDFDITEIDKVAMKMSVQNNKPPEKKPVHAGGISQEDDSPTEGCTDKIRAEVKLNHKRSVLDMICDLSVRRASEMLEIHAIEEIIYLKWKRYRYFYWIWGFFHLLLMSMLTTHAVFKAAAIRSLDLVPIQYIMFIDCVCIIVAIVYIGLEVMRSLVSHQPFEFMNLHHNGIYRVQFILFSICLLIDGIWNLVTITNNHFLIAALLLGWWFNIFFFRAHKEFSFFTIMIHKLIFGDVLRFSIIILFQLISFTASMHVTLLYTTPSGPIGFSTYWTSLFTMFKLMMGLEEMNEIENSSEAWLAITLFILFLIVTYILLLNALIAMMSRTYDVTSDDRNSIWKLQLLSVILFIEGTLLERHRLLCGTSNNMNVNKTLDNKIHRKERFFLKVKNVKRELLGHAVVDDTKSRSRHSDIWEKILKLDTSGGAPKVAPSNSKSDEKANETANDTTDKKSETTK